MISKLSHNIKYVMVFRLFVSHTNCHSKNSIAINMLQLSHSMQHFARALIGSRNYSQTMAVSRWHAKSAAVSVDIFACKNFSIFLKMGNFMCIKIRVFSTSVSLGIL